MSKRSIIGLVVFAIYATTIFVMYRFHSKFREAVNEFWGWFPDSRKPKAVRFTGFDDIPAC